MDSRWENMKTSACLKCFKHVNSTMKNGGWPRGMYILPPPCRTETLKDASKNSEVLSSFHVQFWMSLVAHVWEPMQFYQFFDVFRVLRRQFPTCENSSKKSSFSSMMVHSSEPGGLRYVWGFLGHWGPQMGLSENSVPLHPMVNDHYPY